MDWLWGRLCIMRVVQLEKYVNSKKMLVSIQRHVGEMQTWTDDWAEGSFHEEAGYPSCVFFYQDRLGFAGSKNHNNVYTHILSYIHKYVNMSEIIFIYISHLIQDSFEFTDRIAAIT